MKTIKIIQRKGFQARIKLSVESGRLLLYVRWYTPSGCEITDWQNDPEVLDELLKKLQVWVESKWSEGLNYNLWSY